MEFIIFCDMISLDCKLENELSNLVKALFVFNNVLFSVLHIIIITPSILYSMKKGRYIVPFFLLRSPQIISQEECKLFHYLALHLFMHMHSRVAQFMSLMYTLLLKCGDCLPNVVSVCWDVAEKPSNWNDAPWEKEYWCSLFYSWCHFLLLLFWHYA